jgi:hypothetical protein
MLLALLLTAGVAVATPVITSVTPSQGTVAGGTTVMIRGSGFSNQCAVCLAPIVVPEVNFGGVPAASVEFIDETALRVVTPRHLPGVANVNVAQYSGEGQVFATLPNAFEFTGQIDEAFDPILFPVFSPPVHGQNGSEFRTIAKLWNKGTSAVVVYGLDISCTLFDPPLGPETPWFIAPRGNEMLLTTDCSETAGRMFFVPKGDTSIVTSLRVQEMSRQAENHGVEMPVVRRKDFSDTVALVGVPNDPRFRLTLRIYSLGYGGISTVNVTVFSKNGQSSANHQEQLALLPGPARSPFEPSYAAFTGFFPPSVYGEGDLTVLIENAAPNDPPIWAFITVTNNETQHITTVTPQQD